MPDDRNDKPAAMSKHKPAQKIIFFYCYKCKAYELKTSPHFRSQKARHPPPQSRKSDALLRLQILKLYKQKPLLKEGTASPKRMSDQGRALYANTDEKIQRAERIQQTFIEVVRMTIVHPCDYVSLAWCGAGACVPPRSPLRDRLPVSAVQVLRQPSRFPSTMFAAIRN